MTRKDASRLRAIRALGFATYHDATQTHPFAFTDADGDTLYFADALTALATAQEATIGARVAAIIACDAYLDAADPS